MVYYGQGESYLTLILLALLIYGALIEKHYGTKALIWGLTIIASLTLAFTFFIKKDLTQILLSLPEPSLSYGLWKWTGWTVTLQSFFLFFAFLALPLIVSSLQKPWEMILLYLFMILGGLGIIIASDFLSLFFMIELLSLTLYLLTAIDKNSSRSGEAGLKYFLLGALSSAFLLLGIAFLYGLTGQTNYTALQLTLSNETIQLAQIATILIFSSLLFKIGAAPFHMWLPDVYHGARTTVTGWFAIVPKFSILAAIWNLLFLPKWLILILCSSIASLFIGAFTALNQGILKRLFAYSTLSHTGFLLIAFPAQDPISSFFYLISYQIMSLFIFTFLVALKEKGAFLGDLPSLARIHPILAFSFAITLLSLAGIPPTLGFLAKFTLFLGGVRASFVPLVTIAVLISVIGAIYYIKIIQLSYFFPKKGDKIQELKESIQLKTITKTESYLLAFSTLSILFFFWYPTPLLLPLTEKVIF